MRVFLASTWSATGTPPATPAHTAQETLAGKLAEPHDRRVPAGTTARNVLALILLAASVAATTPPAAAANIVLLVLDDGAALDTAGMPTVQQLAREGATFDHAYTPSPMCAPGRAILQSGLYSQNNGVTQNGYQQFVASGAIDRAFAVGLHTAGVDTRFVGKYMNGAPASVPGWTSFAVQQDTAGSSAKGYYDYTLTIDGRNAFHGYAPGDYSVDVERDLALWDIQAASGRFATMLAVHSPHNPLTPAFRYAVGSPDTLRQRTLLAVDDALKAIIDLLKRTRRYDDTYLVVTSDQGLAFHRNPSKGVPHEGSINVPLVIRGPGVSAGVTLHQLVSLADLAPTFLAWMGAPATGMDGRSLDPPLKGSGGGWRQALPITHERMSSAPGVPSWQGVRTTQYAYWKYQGGGTEVYDMAHDPGQRQNIAGTNPALTQKLAALSDQLAKCRGAGCRSLEDQAIK